MKITPDIENAMRRAGLHPEQLKANHIAKHSRVSRKSTTVNCGDCGKDCSRTGPFQLYCQPCSDKRAVIRKLKWAKANPAPGDLKQKYRDTKNSRLAQVGRLASECNRSGMDEVFSDDTGFAWVRRVAVPFSYSLSKNHMSRIGASGHVYLRKESRQARHHITNMVRSALSDVNVVQAKLWVDLIVHKPNHRGDAVNVLDLVMDAIKDAIPVDDRWFAVKGLDWHIVKENPEMLIGIGQKATVDHQVCSYCGRILPRADFSSNKGLPNGINRGCKECISGSRRKR